MQTLDLIDKLEAIYSSWGYLLVFLSSLIETSPVGFAIPGGLIIALGGFYAYGNKVALIGVIISGSLGMLTTFLAAYVLGRKTGVFLAKTFRQEKIARQAKILLEKHGPPILTTSLLASLTRFWVAYIAGSQSYNLINFLFYAIVASLTWNSLFVVIGYLVGSERENFEYWLARLGIVSYLLVILAMGVIYWKITKEFKKIKT